MPRFADEPETPVEPPVEPLVEAPVEPPVVDEPVSAVEETTVDPQEPPAPRWRGFAQHGEEELNVDGADPSGVQAIVDEWCAAREGATSTVTELPAEALGHYTG